MLANIKTTICFGALFSFCSTTLASPLIPSPGIGGLGIAAISGGPPSGGLGPDNVVNPVSRATTVSNIIANTDIAPQVNVAPTIPIPYPSYYGVPVPVAAGYPVPVPSVFKRWDGDDCCDDDCFDDDSFCRDDSFLDGGFLGNGFLDSGFGCRDRRDRGFGFPSGFPCDSSCNEGFPLLH